MIKSLLKEYIPLYNWKRALMLVWQAAPFYSTWWIAITLVLGLLPGVSVYLTKFTIDSVVDAKNSGGEWIAIQNAIFFGALFIGVIILTQLLQYVYDWLQAAHAEVVNDWIMGKIHKKAGELDIAYFESPEFYDLHEQATGESSTRPLQLLRSLGSIARNAITLIAMFAILLSYGWWLPFVLAAATAPSLLVALITNRRFHRWWKNTSKTRRWANYYDTMLIHDESALEMRQFALSHYYRALYQKVRAGLRVERLKHVKQQGIARFVADLFGLSIAASATVWMALRVFVGKGTLGDLGLFYQIFSQGRSILGSLLGSIGDTIDHGMYLESLFGYFDLEPTIKSSPDSISLTSIERDIVFESVKFSYPSSDANALTGIDLRLEAGKVTALVGVNGSGKTTIVKLLTRFYDPQEGTIRIDGVDLREISLNSLRRAMTVMFQFPLHFHETAAENIRLGDLDRDGKQSDIEDAARLAGAHEFIEALPEGYDTLLGKWFVDGTELSGGEWQRISLARAYYRQAPVIILDEPTSAMDSWTEADWFGRFRQIAKGRTGVVITHRFTVAKRADLICVVDGGRIVEQGSHEELLALGGQYATSWGEHVEATES